MSIVRRLVFCGVIAFSAIPSVVANEPLVLRYEPYPPFVWGEEGRVEGMFAAHTKKIASTAGFKLLWRKGTYRRIMRDLYDNEGQFCVTGYSRSENSAHLVQYSEPYGYFPPRGIAVHRENIAMFKYHRHIYDILADPTIRGAFIDGAKYGEEFNRRVAAGKDRHLRISGEDEDLVRLLAKGRVHFAMVNGAQIQHFKSKIPDGNELVALYPDGMSKNSEVYIVCTLSTPKETLAKLNAVILADGMLHKN